MTPNDAPAAGFFAYNSQLVRLISISTPLQNAEFTPEDAFTLYHLIQEGNVSKRDYGGPTLPALGHAIAGGLASALATAVVYPIDTIVTRMQVQKGLKGEKEAHSAASDADAEYKDPIDAARKIYKNEGGLKAFYAGLSSDVVKHIVDSFLFFLAYSMMKEQMLKRQGGKQLPVLKELSVGVAAGAFAKAITSPIQNIVTRQQTAALLAARDPSSSATPTKSNKLSVKDIALQIRSEKGIAGFWAGYSAQLILTLNPAMTFAVDNTLRSLIPKKYRDNPRPYQIFLVAALSKVIATSITYPVMLAKARAQAAPGASEDDNGVDPSYHKIEVGSAPTRERARQTLRQLVKLMEGQAALLHSLRRIYRNEGLAGLYSGLEGEVVKGFLQHGLTMMAKESVYGGTIQMYYVLLKLTKRWPEEFEKVQQNAAEKAKELGKQVTG
ncbi:mitochondrial carrier [Lecanosticta acicola]|uniref:Mitochondrial carrier n=1 Tax=Lecanosticta acicola TaxID=111012 RepID=A0AAI9EAM2_9PEZI|nr:mitochondrial carrier [Lecanosticta acicola]